MKKYLSVFLAVLLILSLATGCGANSAADSVPRQEAAVEAPGAANGLYAEMGSESTILPENRKLIKTVYMHAETEDLDAILTQVEEQIAALGGYVEERYIHNGSAYSDYRYRDADLTLRIPAESVDNFVSHVSGISNIVSTSESVEDVTLTYVDTEARLTALETEQTRLLELLESAETMYDLLEIEGRLTEVRYELESVASQLRTMDNLISYATVHLSISEVQEYTPTVEKTPWQRIGEGFVRSLKDIGEGLVEFFVWVLSNLPHLVVWGAILTGVFFLLRKLRANKKTRKASRAKKSENTQQ